MHNKWVKICQNKGSILHTIICRYILYEFCIQIVYIMFMMYVWGRSELMHTKCIQNVCIQNVPHILTNFCIQDIYKMFVYKMYTTFRQTFIYISYAKFSWHNSFDFVYTMYTKVCRNMVYILYTFCINQLYASCTIFVYKMYTQFPCGMILQNKSQIWEMQAHQN